MTEFIAGLKPLLEANHLGAVADFLAHRVGLGGTEAAGCGFSVGELFGFVKTPEMVDLLDRVLGDPEWARASALETLAGRVSAHDLLDLRLAEWTRARGARDVMRTLVEAGVPAGHVQRSHDLQQDPQLLHRRFHRFFDHPEMGRIPYSGHAFAVSGYANGPRFPAPLLGGETFEILADELGFEPDRIADLMASGALS